MSVSNNFDSGPSISLSTYLSLTATAKTDLKEQLKLDYDAFVDQSNATYNIFLQNNRSVLASLNNLTNSQLQTAIQNTLQSLGIPIGDPVISAAIQSALSSYSSSNPATIFDVPNAILTTIQNIQGSNTLSRLQTVITNAVASLGIDTSTAANQKIIASIIGGTATPVTLSGAQNALASAFSAFKLSTTSGAGATAFNTGLLSMGIVVTTTLNDAIEATLETTTQQLIASNSQLFNFNSVALQAFEQVQSNFGEIINNISLSPTPDSTTSGTDSTVSFSGSGLGVGNIISTVGLNSPGLGRAILKAMAENYFLQTTHPLPSQLLTNINELTTNLISQAAKGAASSSVVKENATSIEQVPEDVSSLDRANAFGDAIHKLISSNTVDQSINKLILQDPDLASQPLGAKEEIAQVLTGTLKIGLAQLGLTQISLTLGTPGLTGQILGGLPGAPDASTLFNTSDATKLNTALQNPIAEGLLTDEISASLASQGIDPSAIQAAFASTYATPLSSIANFASTLETSLNNQGVPPEIASSASQQASNFLQTETALPFLDQPYNPSVLQAALSQSVPTSSNNDTAAVSNALVSSTIAVNPPPVSSNNDTASVSNTLVSSTIAVNPPPVSSNNDTAPVSNTLVSSTIAVNPPPVSSDSEATNFPPGTINRIIFDQIPNNPAPVKTAIASTVENTNLTSVRDFRSELSSQLQSKGLPSDKIGPIANNVTRLFTPIPTGNPLTEIPPTTVLKPSETIDALNTFVVNKQTPNTGVFQARVKAENTTKAVVNLQSDITENIRVFKEQAQGKIITNTYQRIPLMSTPTAPAYQVKANIDEITKTEVTNYMNPAAQDNIRTQDTNKQPMNFKRNIDIPM